MRIICLFVLLILFSGLWAQPVTCDQAIDLKDSSCTYSCFNAEEVWFRFKATEKKFVMFVLSADSGKPLDYILYKAEQDFCKKISDEQVVPLGTSFHYGKHEYTGLTQEQINGVCCCNTCETRERFLNLKKDSVYYLRVFPRGKEVFIKKDFDFVCEPEPRKDPFKEPVEVGKVIPVYNLNFLPESPQFLPESKKELERVFEFMNRNQNIHVQIQGHVNSPGRKQEASDQILSQARADAVMKYLVKKGISKERITARGFGNTRMLFPQPQNEAEMKANRRVEILITKN